MGQVWRAEDQLLGRLVAVKLLRPEYAEHPETLDRFRAEARHAGILSHPHIAQMYDYGPPQGPGGAALAGVREPYLVMEYVDGPSLADVLECEPLSADLACDVIAQAAAGLDAAHRAGLVHRDVKPGNLLLTSDGRVKVTDFGISQVAGAAPITAPGVVMGTALYMAPERIEGDSGTPASDLYSLGIVMWECLMGRPPFQGTSAAVMAAHLHQALPPLPAWVPSQVCDLIARLTAKDPAYRLSDAGLLAVQSRSPELAGAGARALGRPGAGGPGPVLEDEDLVPVRAVAGYLGALVPATVAYGQAAAADDLPDTVTVLARPGPPAARPAPGPGPSPGDSGGSRPDHGPGGGQAPSPGPGEGDAAGQAPGEVGVIASAAQGGLPDPAADHLTDPAAGAPADPATRAARPAARRSRLAVAITVVVLAGAVVGGLAASGAFGAAPLQEQNAAGPLTTASGTMPRVTYVQVPSFHGQRYAAVSDWLRAHGLSPMIAWAGRTRLPTGTVVSVEPDGPVPVGSAVTVTIAWNSAPPPGGITSLPAAPRPGADATPARSAAGHGRGTSTPRSATTTPAGGGSPTGSGGSTGTSTPPTAGSPTPTTSNPPGGGSTSAPTPAPSCGLSVGPLCL